MKNKTTILVLLACLFTGAVCLFVGSLKLGRVSGQYFPPCYASATPQQNPETNEIDPAVEPYYICSDEYAGYAETPGYELRKTYRWNVSWPPQAGHTTRVNSVTVFEKGKWILVPPLPNGPHKYCWPTFFTPVSVDRNWYQQTREQRIRWNGDIGACTCFDYSALHTTYAPAPLEWECEPCQSGSPPSEPCSPGNWRWRQEECAWSCEESPIIIDLDNDGYNLTDAANGVRFDLNGAGLRQWSWTSRGSDDAFLALDRNGDGRITSGKELFGNGTEQPVSEEPNGFLALAVFDTNNDRSMDERDAIYQRLLLWVDSNHDGVSQASELHSLSWGGVEGIDLDYKLSKKSDQHGNQFRYRAKVRGKNLNRWAWDVFLQSSSD